MLPKHLIASAQQWVKNAAFFGKVRSPDGWSTAMGVVVWMGLLTLYCTAEIQKDWGKSQQESGFSGSFV